MINSSLENLLLLDGNVTPQEISDFDHMRRLKRESLYLSKKPFETITKFCEGFFFLLFQCVHILFRHAWMIFSLFLFIAITLLLYNIPGPWQNFIERAFFVISYLVWWIGLGILSSIGLGSGLQSGVLFLFPHILRVSLAADTCQTLDFESASDIWFNKSEELFRCPELLLTSTPVTFWGIWRKIILVCFLQSAGTAIGEIPPYWMTKSAREASLLSQHPVEDEIPEELEANSSYAIVNKGKIFMVWLLQEYGFYGVLFMASYPNIAFDLCGICCGHFLMPFWRFFLATLIGKKIYMRIFKFDLFIILGKAIIRNAYQSILYVMFCRLVFSNLPFSNLSPSKRTTFGKIDIDRATVCSRSSAVR